MSDYLLTTTINREHAERIATAREDAMAREIRRTRRARRRAERRSRPRQPSRTHLLARLSRRVTHAAGHRA